MGQCSSCLGLRQADQGDSENPETSRLLDDSPYRTQYGTYGQNRARPQDQTNPTEMTPREREAHSHIGTMMSDNVLDVSGTLPRTSNGDTRSPAGDPFRAETHTSDSRPAPAEISKRQVIRKAYHEQSPQDTSYKSVRGSKRGRTSSGFYKNRTEWKTAKALMG
ncbi:hypothetical protein N7G274_002584 [Stereocaulon virgatum]|uniref:Uncharacterized protein n=1 Tax=Stereocaulon virgatum TaxID=373712 RepID=A0ABR4AJD9_9LECA